MIKIRFRVKFRVSVVGMFRASARVVRMYDEYHQTTTHAHDVYHHKERETLLVLHAFFYRRMRTQTSPLFC